MEIITRRDRIRGVKASWDRQYGDRRKETSRLLGKLDLETCSEEDVANIIGNDSWTTLDCDLCGHRAEKVVLLASDKHDRGVGVCGYCLNRALDMFKAVPGIKQKEES